MRHIEYACIQCLQDSISKEQVLCKNFAIHCCIDDDQRDTYSWQAIIPSFGLFLHYRCLNILVTSTVYMYNYDFDQLCVKEVKFYSYRWPDCWVFNSSTMSDALVKTQTHLTFPLANCFLTLLHHNDKYSSKRANISMVFFDESSEM